MAVLWSYQTLEKTWQAFALSHDDVGLSGDRAHPLADEAAAVVVAPAGAGNERLLLSRPGATVWVNGDPLLLGVRLLHDRDAIRVGSSESVFYSSESLGEVVPFPVEQPLPCARCKSAIKPRTPALACPSCGAWHHQDADLPCWTYAERCSGCAQPTALDGTYHWTPEGL